MEHRLRRGGTKNGPKIKIDFFLFVEIEKKFKKIKSKLQGGCKLKKKFQIRLKIE